MKILGSRIFWGIVLILCGVIFLLQFLEVIEYLDIIWGLLLGLGGLFFFSIYGGNKDRWWAIIPGMTLLGISLLLILETFFPDFTGDLGGTIVVGAIGISFFLVYLINRTFWWAVIPGGVMLTVAAMTGLEPYLTDVGTIGLFFFGVGITFAILTFLPAFNGSLKWAWIPAFVCGLIGVIMVVFSLTADIIPILFALALVLAGFYIIYRGVVVGRKQ
jgi:hypothetical protein